MADATRSTFASIDTTTAIQSGNKIPRLPGTSLNAAVDIPAAGVPLRIDANGDFALAAGDVAGNTEIIGFSAKAYKAGEAVTAYRDNTVFYYSESFAADGISPGDDLFLSNTAGNLATTVGTVAGVAPVARVLDDRHILITRAA